MDEGTTGATPGHLWIVGILSLIWTAASAFDFLMINMRNPAYLDLRGMPGEMMQLIDGFPLWILAAWALGVGTAVLGSLLLLLRSYHAAYAFALSLLGLAATVFYRFGLGSPEEMTGPGRVACDLAVLMVAAALLLYSIRMRTRRVLR